MVKRIPRCIKSATNIDSDPENNDTALESENCSTTNNLNDRDEIELEPPVDETTDRVEPTKDNNML